MKDGKCERYSRLSWQVTELVFLIVEESRNDRDDCILLDDSRRTPANLNGLQTKVNTLRELQFASVEELTPDR